MSRMSRLSLDDRLGRIRSLVSTFPFGFSALPDIRGPIRDVSKMIAVGAFSDYDFDTDRRESKMAEEMDGRPISFRRETISEGLSAASVPSCPM